MRILITGADGQLGCELQRVLAGHQLMLGIWPEFDLLGDGVERCILDAKPDVVIHAAAYTDVERAEREPGLAMAVNGEGTGRVARAVGKVGGRLVYVSTDYVFDGRKREPYVETDQPNPINAYGRSKLEGERQALAHCSNVVVVRTAWLYGTTGKNFVQTVMQLAEHEPELRIVADQRGSPTYAGDLAQAIVRLLAADIRGVTHATGSGDCTWHEFATAIISLMGSSVPVKPITTAEAKREAVRPPYTVLANRVLARAGITLPHWRDALTRFMAEFRTGAVKGERG